MRTSLLSCLLLLAVASPLRAQDGWFDAGFGNGGRVVLPVGGIFDDMRTVRVQADGKFLLAGDCVRQRPTGQLLTYFCLARVRPDGQFDYGFGPAGLGYLLSDQLALAGISFELVALALLPDGRIVVAGNSTSSPPVVVVIKADGSAVEATTTVTFNPAAPGASLVTHLETLPDGRILAVGSSPSPAGVGTDFAVMRLSANLAVDTTFGSGGVAYAGFVADPAVRHALADTAAVQVDGRIVLAGRARRSNGTDDFAVARLLANGQRDVSFNGSGRTTYDMADDDSARAVAIDRRGRIVVAGNGRPYAAGGWGYDFIVNRLLPNGTQDPGFGNGGPVDPLLDFGGDNWDVLYAMALQGDGKILLAGYSRYSDTQRVFSLARLDEDGTQDWGFGINGASHGVFEPGAASVIEAEGVGMALGPRGLYVFGNARHHFPSRSLQSFGMARLTLNSIFADGFDP